MASELVRTLRVIIAGDAKSAIEAFGKTSQEAEKSQSKIEKLESRLNTWSAGILAVGAAAGAALLKIGTDLDEAMDTIRLGTGATGDALQGLGDSFKTVLGQVPSDMQDVATAIADVNTRLGLTGDVLEDVSKQFVLLADLTGDNVSSMIEQGSRALAAWNVTADRQSEMLNILWRASQASGASISDLTRNLIDVGPALQSFGFSMEGATVFLAGLERAGLNTGQVLMGLRSGLGRLAKEGRDPAQALAEFTTAVQNAGSNAEALQIGVETFGSRAGPLLAQAIRDGKLNFEELSDAILNGTDTIEQATWDTADFSEKLQLLKNKAIVELSPLAEGLFEVINKLVDALASAAEWAGRNRPLMEGLAWAIGSIAGAILAATGALKVYQGIVKAVRVATTLWTAAQWLLNVAMNANPIGLIILGIALLIGIIILLWNKCEAFRNFFIGLWEKIREAAGAVGRWFKEVLWEQWIKGAWDAIVGAGQGALDWFKSLPEKIKNAFSTLWDIITRPFKDAFNAVAGFWNRTIGKLSIKVPDWVPGIGGKGFSFPQLPMLAKGGRLRAGQPAIVGEKGWELWIPDHPGTVVPQDKITLVDQALAAAPATNAGTTIILDVEVIVEGNVTAERDLAKSIAIQVRDQIERVNRLNGRPLLTTTGRG